VIGGRPRQPAQRDQAEPVIGQRRRTDPATAGLESDQPVHAAGTRIDPPPSAPSPMGATPAASATAVPPDDPPGERLMSHGLRVTPNATDSVNGNWPNSGIVVVPITTAPAARSRRTISLSACAGVVLPRPPSVVTRPATSNSVLRQRNSGERAVVPGTAGVDGARLGQRLLPSNRDETVVCRLRRLRSLQRRCDDLFSRQGPGAHGGGGLDGGHLRERGHARERRPQPRPPDRDHVPGGPWDQCVRSGRAGTWVPGEGRARDPILLDTLSGPDGETAILGR